MKKVKRSLSVLLAVCLLLSCVPMTALAAEGSEQQEPVYTNLVLRCLENVDGKWMTVPFKDDPATVDKDEEQIFFDGVLYPQDMASDGPALPLGESWYAAAYILDGHGKVARGPLNFLPLSVKAGNVSMQRLADVEDKQSIPVDNQQQFLCITPTAEADEGQTFTLAWNGPVNLSATYGISLPESGFYSAPPKSKETLLAGELEYTPEQPIEFYLITEPSRADWMQDVKIATDSEGRPIAPAGTTIKQEKDPSGEPIPGLYKINASAPADGRLGFDVVISWTMKDPNNLDEGYEGQKVQRSISLHPPRPEPDGLPIAGFYRGPERTAENLIDPGEDAKNGERFEYSLLEENNQLYFLWQPGAGIHDVEMVDGGQSFQLVEMENGYQINILRLNVPELLLGLRWMEYAEEKYQRIWGSHAYVNATEFITEYPTGKADDDNLTRMDAVRILIGLREGWLGDGKPDINAEIDCTDVVLHFNNMNDINALSEDDQTILKKAVKIQLLGAVNTVFDPNEPMPRCEMAFYLGMLSSGAGVYWAPPPEADYNTYPANVEYQAQAQVGDRTETRVYTDSIKHICWKTDYVNSENRLVDSNGSPDFKPTETTTQKVALEWAWAIYQLGFSRWFLTAGPVSPGGAEIIKVVDRDGREYRLIPGAGWRSQGAEAEPPTGVSYDRDTKTLTLAGTTLKQVVVNGMNLPGFVEGSEDTPPTHDSFKLVLSGENKITPTNAYGVELISVAAEITSSDEGSLNITPDVTQGGVDAAGLFYGRSSVAISGNAQVNVNTTFAQESFREETYWSCGIQGEGPLTVTDTARVDVTGCGSIGIWNYQNAITVQGTAVVKTDYIIADSITVQDSAALTVTPDFPVPQKMAINARRIKVTGGTMTVTEGPQEGNGLNAHPMVGLGSAPDEVRTDGGYYQSGGTVTMTTGGKHGYQCALALGAGKFEVTGGTLNVTGRWEGIWLGQDATALIANENTEVNVSAIGVNNGIVDTFPATFAIDLCGPMTVTGGTLNATASGGTESNYGIIAQAGNGLLGELAISGGTHTFTGTTGTGAASAENYGVYAKEIGTVYFNGGTVTLEGGRCAAYGDRPGADNCSFILGDGMHMVDHSDDIAHTSGDAGTPGTELAFLSDTDTSNEGIERHLYFLRKNNNSSEPSVTRAVVSGTSGAVPDANRAEVTLRAQGSNPVAGSLISMIAEVDAPAGTKSLLTVALPAGMTLESGSVTLNGEKLTDSLTSIPVVGPGTLRFSVRAAAAGSYTVTATAANTQRQLASASYDLTVFPSFSINYPSFTSDTAEELPITGTAAPNSTVTLKAPASGGSDKTVDVSSTGTYSTTIKLADYGNDWADGNRLELEAWTGGAKQKDVVITYLSGLPKLTSFDVLNYVQNGKKRVKDRVHYAHGAQDSGTEAKGRESVSYIYWPGEDELEFEVKFHEIPESYQSDLRVRLTLSNGQTVDSALSYTSKGKKWDGRYTIQNENLPVGFTVVSLSGGTAIWSSEYISMTPIIDPSGYIYEGTKDNRIEGATAKLYYIPDQASKPTGGVGSGTLWADAEKYLQINPIITGADGSFAWNVPVGWWRVQAEKDGLTGTSDWMHVLPAQTGVEIALESSAPAELSSIVRSEDGKYLTLTFSKPVGVKDVYSETLPILDTNGQIVPGSYYPANGDNANAAEFYFVPENGTLPQKYVQGKLIENSVTTYNSEKVAAADVSETDPPQDADDGSGEDDDPVTPVGPSGPGGSSTPDPVVTENPDGSQATTETASDGTVTATTTWEDGSKAVAVKAPTGEKTIVVTTAKGEKATDVKLPAKPAEGKKFDDVQGGWYKSAVDTVTGYGLFNGTSATTFSPDDGMTRGMLATVLYNLSGEPEYGTDEKAFTDVKSNSWYEDPVDWAYKIGVTSGTGKSQFSPDKDITREQLVTMLYRYAEKIGAASSKRADISSFADSGNVAGFAQNSMKWAVAQGLISGRSNGGKTLLAPQGTATRAEVAAVMTRFVEYLKK